MHVAPRLIALLVVAGALAPGGVSQAGEPEAVATARSSASDVPPAGAPAGSGAAATSVADQIDAYLKTSPALALPKEGANGVTAGEEAPRKAHGMVDVAVGSNGYRSAFVRSDLPLGKTGSLSIAVGQTRFKGRGLRYWGGYADSAAVNRQSLALGLSAGTTALDPHDPRCRQIAEEGFDRRLNSVDPGACASLQAPHPSP